MTALFFQAMLHGAEYHPGFSQWPQRMRNKLHCDPGQRCCNDESLTKVEWSELR